jgi:cyclopropane-fatty-acyl-phospholipid synthase
MNKPDSNRQLIAARAIAAHVAEHLGADLSLELWDGSIVPLGEGARDDVRLLVRSPGAVRQLLFRPSLMTLFELFAAGELGISGATPLEAVKRWDHLKALALPRRVSKALVLRHALAFLGPQPRTAPGAAAWDDAVQARPESGRRDQDLIRFHYDVSNAFYGLFLDPEMVYSSGYFESPETSLEAAQQAKLDMICRRLRLKEGELLLDIGCGWGGLVCHAAQHFGVRALGVTLSQRQFDFATAKVAALGLQDRVEIRLADYRSIEPMGQFDAIAQIEMFEHLGIDNHDRHFEFIHGLLKPRGRYLHQSSVRRAPRDLASFRKPTAYQKVITRFIFPGGELDHIGMTATNLERHGFEVHDIENWREHFQLTLEHWVARLAKNEAAAIAEIGADRTRLWLLYMSLFAVGFERGTCLVFQTLASKRQPGPSGLPLTRRDLYD